MDSFPTDLSVKPEVTAFFDEASSTFTYVVKDPASPSCAVVDSVLDLDYAAGRLCYGAADKVIDHITQNGLTLEWLIETHVHADHLSAAPYIQERLGGKIGIGADIKTVQETFGKVFNEGTEFQRDGSQFDTLFGDLDTYTIGTMKAFTLHTPGHTPACMVHVVGDAAFVGDTLFMPDSGTARADFPGGSARTLYRSIMRVLLLPDEMRLFMCHDYGAGGSRDVAFQTTVGHERTHNVHVGTLAGKAADEDAFVALREARDATLAVPKLIIPSLQVNMKGGRLPEPDADGVRNLKVPLGKL